MSISDNYEPDETLGNGVTDEWSGSWYAIAKEYFRLYLKDVVTGALTLKTIDTDYTLVFDTDGYTATWINGTPPSSDYIILRAREITIDQTNPYTTSKGYQGRVLENSFDKITGILQELKDESNRSLKFVLGSSSAGITVPEPQANYFIAWNSAGDGLENSAGVAGPTGPTGAAGASIYNGGTATGTANALLVTSSPTLGQLSDLNTSLLAVKIGTTNTSGTVTIGIGALATQSIKKFIGGGKVDIAVGDLKAGEIAMFSRDGTDVILTNPHSYAKGATIASASTVVLDNATGDYVQISGTTGITAITLTEGREVTCKFDGILTITNGASLVNLSGANITTAAGDIAIFRGEASGVVRMIDHRRADGSPTNQSQNASLASASTVNIGAASGDFLQITGTVTITAFDNVRAGIERTVYFAGVLTLTHNGTSLLLPGGSNITTAANDRAIFRSLGSGNWICISYARTGSTGVIISNASNSTSIIQALDFTNNYEYEIRYAGVTNSTGAALTINASDDATPNWDDPNEGERTNFTGTTPTYTTSSPNVVLEGLSTTGVGFGRIILSQGLTNRMLEMTYESFQQQNTGGGLVRQEGSAAWRIYAVPATNVRLLMASGNILTGVFTFTPKPRT